VLKSLQFHNFKALREVDVDDLDRLNVLVGPNGSGKTSVLEAVHYVAQLGTRPYCSIFTHERDPKHLLRRGEKEMSVSLSGQWAGSEGNLTLSIEREVVNRPPPDEPLERHEFKVKGSWGDQPYESENAEDVLWNQIADFGSEISRVVMLRLEASSLAKPSYSERRVPRVEYNGYGLASVVGYMAGNQPDRFKGLVETLKRIVPIVEAVRVERAEVPLPGHLLREGGGGGVGYGDGAGYGAGDGSGSGDGSGHGYGGGGPRHEPHRVWGEALVFDMRGAPNLPAHAVSEGTLLTLGLLAVLCGPATPRLVLLDDLDRTLHPLAQKSLVEVIRELLQATPDLQILATSHSPYLLDHLQHDEVRLTTLTPGGEAVCAHLSKHPDFERWKELMTPGELWSSVGEQWLTQTGAEDD